MGSCQPSSWTWRHLRQGCKSRAPMGDVLEVHEIRGRPPVLRNAHRVTLGLNLGNDLSGLALEGSHKFCPHKVILKWHFAGSKILPRDRMLKVRHGHTI